MNGLPAPEETTEDVVESSDDETEDEIEGVSTYKRKKKAGRSAAPSASSRSTEKALKGKGKAPSSRPAVDETEDTINKDTLIPISRHPISAALLRHSDSLFTSHMLYQAGTLPLTPEVFEMYWTRLLMLHNIPRYGRAEDDSLWHNVDYEDTITYETEFYGRMDSFHTDTLQSGFEFRRSLTLAATFGQIAYPDTFLNALTIRRAESFPSLFEWYQVPSELTSISDPDLDDEDKDPDFDNEDEKVLSFRRVSDLTDYVDRPFSLSAPFIGAHRRQRINQICYPTPRNPTSTMQYQPGLSPLTLDVFEMYWTRLLAIHMLSRYGDREVSHDGFIKLAGKPRKTRSDWMALSKYRRARGDFMSIVQIFMQDALSSGIWFSPGLLEDPLLGIPEHPHYILHGRDPLSLDKERREHFCWLFRGNVVPDELESLRPTALWDDTEHEGTYKRERGQSTSGMSSSRMFTCLLLLSGSEVLILLILASERPRKRGRTATSNCSEINRSVTSSTLTGENYLHIQLRVTHAKTFEGDTADELTDTDALGEEYDETMFIATLSDTEHVQAATVGAPIPSGDTMDELTCDIAQGIYPINLLCTSVYTTTVLIFHHSECAAY